MHREGAGGAGPSRLHGWCLRLRVSLPGPEVARRRVPLSLPSPSTPSAVVPQETKDQLPLATSPMWESQPFHAAARGGVAYGERASKGPSREPWFLVSQASVFYTLTPLLPRGGGNRGHGRAARRSAGRGWPSCRHPTNRHQAAATPGTELSPTCSYQEGFPRSSGPCAQRTLLWRRSSQGWTIKQERD